MLTFDLTLPRHPMDYAVTLPAKVTFLLNCYHRLYGTKREGSSGAEFPAMLTFDLTLPRHRVTTLSLYRQSKGRFGPDWVSESGVGTLSEIGTTDASQSHKALADLSPITCERLGGAGGGGLVMSWS
ncbi:hypothetical protein J6590_098134 [Homalodisca vitripennis]|nr:hypothetical protein J6590_098134 [Homalodisca vitripennis]